MVDKYFKTQSKESWLELVSKDLKGKPFDQIQYEVEPGLMLDPLYTGDEVERYDPISWNTNREWNIVERFVVDQGACQKELNKQILASLEGGCQVVEVRLHAKSMCNPQVLFENVMLEMIDVRIEGDEENVELISAFEKDYKSINSIRGEKKLMSFVGSSCFRFRIGDQGTVSDEMAKAISEIGHFMITNRHANWSDIIIDISVGSHLLVEVSRIRSLKLLIHALSDKLEKPLVTWPIILAEVEANIIKEELESLIECSSKATSAVLGGVDEIIIDPAFNSQMPLSDLGKRRIKRNILWLLKEESTLGKKVDHMNGSYWIEKCTQSLVERAWEKIK